MADTSLHGWNHQNYHQKPCHQGQRSRRLLSDQKDPESKRLPLLSWLLSQSQQPSPQLCCALLFKVHSPQHCRNKLLVLAASSAVTPPLGLPPACTPPVSRRTTGLRGCRGGRCLDTKGFELATAPLTAGAVPVSGPRLNNQTSLWECPGRAHSGRLAQNTLVFLLNFVKQRRCS